MNSNNNYSDRIEPLSEQRKIILREIVNNELRMIAACDRVQTWRLVTCDEEKEDTKTPQFHDLDPDRHLQSFIDSVDEECDALRDRWDELVLQDPTLASLRELSEYECEEQMECIYQREGKRILAALKKEKTKGQRGDDSPVVLPFRSVS